MALHKYVIAILGKYIRDLLFLRHVQDSGIGKSLGDDKTHNEVKSLVILSTSSSVMVLGSATVVYCTSQLVTCVVKV